MLDHSRLGLENKFFPNKITKAKKKTTTWHVQHTFFVQSFLCRCFARRQRETSRNFLVTRFMEEMLYVVLFTFFRCRSFLPWWPLAFLIFSQPLRNVHVILQKKLVFFVFLSLALGLSLLSTPM